MDDMQTIDAALVRLAQANHAEAGRSAELIGQAQTLRQNMNVAARRLRRVRDSLLSQGEAGGAASGKLAEVDAEYTKACQTRALMDSLLGAAFVVNARIGKGAAKNSDGDGNDNGLDGGGNQRGASRATGNGGGGSGGASGAARAHGRGRFRQSPG